MKIIVIIAVIIEIAGFCLFAYAWFGHGPHTWNNNGKSKPIKGVDIIEENALNNAIRNAKELKKVYEDLNIEVEKLKESTKDLGKSE